MYFLFTGRIGIRCYLCYNRGNILFPYNTPDHLLKLGTRQHNKPAAALTFDAKIHPRPQNLPQVTAAWMLFFHPYNIANFVLYFFHIYTLPIVSYFIPFLLSLDVTTTYVNNILHLVQHAGTKQPPFLPVLY